MSRSLFFVFLELESLLTPKKHDQLRNQQTTLIVKWNIMQHNNKK